MHSGRPVARVRSRAVVSLLFVLRGAVRWCEALIVILDSRIKERQPIS